MSTKLTDTIKAALKELQQERATIDAQIKALSSISVGESKAKAPRKGGISKAGRARIAAAARKRWRRWRKVKAAEAAAKARRKLRVVAKTTAKASVLCGALLMSGVLWPSLARAQQPDAPIACPPVSATRVCDLTYRTESPSADVLIVRNKATGAVIIRAELTGAGEVTVAPPAPAPGTDHVLAEVVVCDTDSPVGLICSAPAEREIFLPDLSVPALVRALVDGFGALGGLR